MIAVTHVTFAGFLGFLAGLTPQKAALLGLGALLPDLDHPRSFLGRAFFYVSIPLHHFLGHRKAFHGFPLWIAFTALGYFKPEIYLVGLGAISHILLDCWNISGVQALEPFSERVLVLFSRKYRIATGSSTEYILLICLLFLTAGTTKVNAIGGFRGLVAYITASPKIALQQYKSKGPEICYLSGKLRWKNGEIEQISAQIVGLEGFNGVALRLDDRLVHVPAQANLLKARLKCSGQKYETLRLTGFAKTLTEAYFFDGKAWRFAKPENYVFGQILGSKLSLEMIEIDGESHL